MWRVKKTKAQAEAERRELAYQFDTVSFARVNRARVLQTVALGISPWLNRLTAAYKERGVFPITPCIIARHYSDPDDKATSCPRFRIRKLTPLEAFRLMDVDSKDIEKIQAYRYPDSDFERDCHGAEVVNVETGKRQRHRAGQPISNSAQYRLAGNSIVVSCLYHIFKNMFITAADGNAAQAKPSARGEQLSMF